MAKEFSVLEKEKDEYRDLNAGKWEGKRKKGITFPTGESPRRIIDLLISSDPRRETRILYLGKEGVKRCRRKGEGKRGGALSKGQKQIFPC